MKKANLTFLFLFAVGMAVPVIGSALTPQNATTLCDRFVEGPDRVSCEKKMKDLAPDWYLASLCSKQYDDKAFYQCVELTKTASFSPKHLESCDVEGFSDKSRFECIKGTRTAASSVEPVYQTREIQKKRVAPKGSQRMSEGY